MKKLVIWSTLLSTLVLLLSISVIAAPSQVVLKVAYAYNPAGNPALANWLTESASEFEAIHPNVKIAFVQITGSEGDYYTKLDLMMRSPSTAPDIVYEDSFMIPSDAAAGFLLPLDKYVQQWPDWQQFYPMMQDIVKFNGNIYGIMNGTDVQVIWYNQDIFKEAGISVPWQPKNWEDIIKAAELIKQKVPGVIPLNIYSGVPADEASTLRGFENLLYGTAMASNSLYDWNTGKWVISSKGIKDTLDFIQKVFTQGLAEPLQVALNPQCGLIVQNQLLPEGKLAMDIDGFWIWSSWLPGRSSPWPDWEKVMGLALIPTQYGQAPHYVSLSGGWALSISSACKNPDLAWDFVKTANSAQNLASFDFYAANIAVRKDELNYQIYSNSFLSNKIFSEAMQYTNYRPAFTPYPKISYQIDLAMETVMLGQPVESAMSSYADAVTGIVGSQNVESIK